MSRCRYLLDSGIQCEREALDERFTVLLCRKHTLAGMELLSFHREMNGEFPGEQAKQTAQSKDLGQVVYYLRFGDRVKIGTTSNLRKRLETIPHDALLGVEVGGSRLEQQRHLEFRHCRINGEWFAADDDLLAHIRSLPPVQMTSA